MATNVFMPALEMAQESGVLVAWLKREGEAVSKGEPLMEIETDKVTVEIEAPASGILGGLLAREGDVVPVGQTIGWILAPGEVPPAVAAASGPSGRAKSRPDDDGRKSRPAAARNASTLEVSPLAKKVAEEHGVDISLIKPVGRRIEKSDVLAYVQGLASAPAPESHGDAHPRPGRILASPKARRLASERGIDIGTLSGSGLQQAVLAADVPAASKALALHGAESNSTIWRLMAEHMTSSWTSVPHFYLIREVDATRLKEWREHLAPAVERLAGVKPTYTDLLIRLLGFALRDHPRLNASWSAGGIQWNREVNVGFATAVPDGLIVPVIHGADSTSISEIARLRHDLVMRAQDKKLHPADIAGGTFTLTNLGMYNVDIFNAIVNTPQAGILAVGRIADRVVPVKGQVVIRPMMALSLSCDHRLVDGARAAQFIDDLANVIEDPLGLLG